MSRGKAKPIKGSGSLFTDDRSPFLQLSYWNGWRQVRESSGTKDRDEAQRILRRKLDQVSLCKSAGAERIRIAALLSLFVEDHRRHDRADLNEAQQRVNRLLMPEFGEMRAAEFTTKALNAYIARRQKEGRKNATINRELAILRRAFRLGYEHDPQLVFRVPVIKALKEDNVREGFLEADKYQVLLEALSQYVKPVFVVAYHLGMRTGELLALKRSWVDLEEGLIYVNGRVTKNRDPKTAPIYGDMGHWLEKILEEGREQSPKCIWLFSRNGKPIRSFKGDWEQACAASGVPELLFHDLRRTAVRNMIRAGVPEKVAMQISGHKTRACCGATTLRTRATSRKRASARKSTSKAKRSQKMRTELRSVLG